VRTPTAPVVRSDDAGTGLIGTAAGVLGVVLFLTFACQLLIGLHATTAVRAALHLLQVT
jgi:hypothetical protein